MHVGFAISMRQGGGLIAPAIHDVHLKNLDELMAAMHELIPRARSGRLRSSELTRRDHHGDKPRRPRSGSTVFGVIYPPQVALVGFGRIKDRAVG